MANTPAVGTEENTSEPIVPCIEASQLIQKVSDRAFHDVRRLANILCRVNLDSRREDLLDYIRLNRARFTKVYAAISWLAGKQGEVVLNASNALAAAKDHQEQVNTSQDHFFFVHSGLFGARQRLFDVPVAVDVLVSGEYPRLPKGIEYCGGNIDPRPIFELPPRREKIVPRVERAIRLALLRTGGVPREFTSHTIQNGVLTLFAAGEFEVRWLTADCCIGDLWMTHVGGFHRAPAAHVTPDRTTLTLDLNIDEKSGIWLDVTLQEERQDASWTLLGVRVKIQARHGEAVSVPPTDFRQRRYLHEVVQKAMDVHQENGDAKFDALLAAFRVCYDFCCNMVLEVLHSQAQTLSSRVGGLWASQLAVNFHKEAQVLDLCLWQNEFSTGIGGTGQDVGMGGSSPVIGTVPTAVAERSNEKTRRDRLPQIPSGCRYIRIYRSKHRMGKIVIDLGPESEGYPIAGHEGGSSGMRGGGHLGGAKCTAAEEWALGITVEIQPDSLSCGQILLAAARTFAARKITALARDLECITRELGTRAPRVAVAGRIKCCLCPWGDGVIEISVDVKSGRFAVHDTSSRSSKLMPKYAFRLSEALNLLPSADLRGVGETVVDALWIKDASTEAVRAPDEHGRDVEQHDLRQQQVRRCIMELFGFLRREEVEQVLRRAFGMMPCRRWGALLGRTGVSVSGIGVESQGADGVGICRTFVCLNEFREEGVSMSNEWRQRARSSRLRRRDPGVIELTSAERAATANRLEAVGLPNSLQPSTTSSVPQTLGLPCDWHANDGLPGLAASLAEVSDGEDHDTRRTLRPTNTRDSVLKKDRARPGTPAKHFEETSEGLLFFLEISVNASTRMEYNLVVASLSEGPAGGSPLRPAVCETYQIRCCPQRVSSCASLEVALLPTLESEFPLRKRSWSDRLGGWDTTKSRDPNNMLSGDMSPDFSRHAKKRALAGVSDDVFAAPGHDVGSSPSESSTTSEIVRVLEAVQASKCLVPYARLEHALSRVGTGISLDLHGLCQLPMAAENPSNCTVLLRGEEGWSSTQLAATSARVHFLPGHDEADRWEWEVTLDSSTCIQCYIPSRFDSVEERRAISRHLPLVEHMKVAADKSAEGVRNSFEVDGSAPATDDGECVTCLFGFPPSFSLHAMCRSFALAGEGLTAMLHLASQAAKISRGDPQGTGYIVGSCSPLHVAFRDVSNGHVVLLTHSAFSVQHISSSARPGLVLIPQPGVKTCPAALRELEASVRKHLDLNAVAHGLSRTVPFLAIVADVVPGVGFPPSANGMFVDVNKYPTQFLLKAISPACYILSAPGVPRRPRSPKATLTFLVEAGGEVRVTEPGGKESILSTVQFRELLLEWVASRSRVGRIPLT